MSSMTPEAGDWKLRPSGKTRDDIIRRAMSRVTAPDQPQAPLVYVVDHRPSGDTSHATTNLGEAIAMLRYASNKECGLVIINYDTGKRVADYEFTAN